MLFYLGTATILEEGRCFEVRKVYSRLDGGQMDENDMRIPGERKRSHFSTFTEGGSEIATSAVDYLDFRRKVSFYLGTATILKGGRFFRVRECRFFLGTGRILKIDMRFP